MNHTDRYESRFRAVLEALRSPDAVPLDLHRLAEQAALSPYHWHRLYHQFMGESMAATRRRRRLHRAAWLLRHSSQPIATIAARSAKSIPPTHSQPPRIRPRAWWLLAANLAVAIALPALKALDSGIPAFWPFAVLTVLNLAAWRGDYRQQAVMQEERRPAPAATRPRHSVRNWYKPAHLVARANGRACARLFLLAMLGVPFTNALSKHYIFFSICLVIPIALTARSLWRELRFAFSASEQPVARIDSHGLHLAVRGNRLHAGALTLHIAWDDLADIRARASYVLPARPTIPEILVIRSHSGDNYRIRTAPCSTTSPACRTSLGAPAAKTKTARASLPAARPADPIRAPSAHRQPCLYRPLADYEHPAATTTHRPALPRTAAAL